MPEYKNTSDAYIKERIEVSSLKNVNIIPLLQDGFFISNPDLIEEETKPETKEESKPKSKNNTFKGKKNNIETNLDENKVNEKIDYESKTVSKTINELKGTKLESYYEIIDQSKPPLIQFNIAPHSLCAILLQKTGDGGSDNDKRTFQRQGFRLSSRVLVFCTWAHHVK